MIFSKFPEVFRWRGFSEAQSVPFLPGTDFKSAPAFTTEPHWRGFSEA
jgi:hypothetical protein